MDTSVGQKMLINDFVNQDVIQMQDIYSILSVDGHANTSAVVVVT